MPCLLGLTSTATTTSSNWADGALEDVDMAEGHRVERSRDIPRRSWSMTLWQGSSAASVSTRHLQAGCRRSDVPATRPTPCGQRSGGPDAPASTTATVPAPAQPRVVERAEHLRRSRRRRRRRAGRRAPGPPAGRARAASTDRDGARAAASRPRTPSAAMFWAMTAAARWSDSTNNADVAPARQRLQPERARAGVQVEHRRRRRSRRARVSTLNSDSRTRSVVGRVPVRRHRDSPPAQRRRRRCGSADHHQQVTALDLRGGRDGDPADCACLGRGDRGFHLHRLDGGDGLSGVDLVAGVDVDGDHAGERRGDVVGVGPVGLLRGRNCRWRCCGRAPPPAAAGR